MNEKKRSIILLIVIAVFIGFTIVCVNISSKRILDEFKEYYNSPQMKIVVFGKEDSTFSQAHTSEMNFMSEEYKFSYEYIDISGLNSAHRNELLKMLEIDESTFDVPYTVIVQNGKKIDEIIGAAEEDKILEFLKNNKFAPEDAEILINYIDFNEYIKAIDSPNIQVVVLGRTSCIYCKMAKPVINNIVKKYGIDINYINYDLLIEEERKLLSQSVTSLIGTNEWGTPAFLILKDGVALNGNDILGYLSEEEYVQAFQHYGVIGVQNEK